MFFEDLRYEIAQTIHENKTYAELSRHSGFSPEMEFSDDTLEFIPYVKTSDFKLSSNSYKKLVRTNQIDLWTVSSGTSEDVSIVGRTREDIASMYNLWRARFKEFFFYDAVTCVYNFAPASRLMKVLAKRESKIGNSQMFLACINEAYEQKKSAVNYLVKIRPLKTIVKAISKRSKLAVAELDKEFLVRHLKKRKPSEFIVLGGNALLMNNLIINYMAQKEIRFDLDGVGAVCSGGGGWDGVKAQIKMNPINKEEWIENNYKIYGIKPDFIRDIYGFDESSTAFGGHWSKKYKEFIMHCPLSSRIVVRDLEKLNPVKPGGIGLIEVVSPYAVKGYVGAAVLGDDIVRLLGDNRHTCLECGYKGASFIILGRSKAAAGRSCASLLKWS
jgi:hypothetical protein